MLTLNKRLNMWEVEHLTNLRPYVTFQLSSRLAIIKSNTYELGIPYEDIDELIANLREAKTQIDKRSEGINNG